MNIPPISDLSLSSLGALTEKPQASSALQQVGQTFQQALSTLDGTQANSDSLMKQLAAGEDVDIANVMVAAEQTDISFRIAMAIRDRLVDAYREMMRMSV